MANRQRLQVKTVGVIGAGVSGVASAIHLRKAGLQVTVFERNLHIGGVWCVARALLLISFRDDTNFQSGSLTSAHPKTPRIPLRNLQWGIHPSTKDRRLRARVVRSGKTARVAVLSTIHVRGGKLLQWSSRRLDLATRVCGIMFPLMRWRCSARRGRMGQKSS
jgi:hypothetical protein